MAISMDRFSSQGHFATYQPAAPVVPQRVAVFELQCRSCGYEPEGMTPPQLCPKCHGNSWERFARPGSLLANAQRF